MKSNHSRKWQIEQASRYGGILRLGSRHALREWPVDVLISITHGVNMSLPQMLVSTLVNQLFILPPLARNENLLYAELHGDLRKGESLVITVWRGRAMVEFRERGAHGWAKDRLTGLVFGHNVTAWFLTYVPRDHQIPSAAKARQLSEQFGRILSKGRFVRSATRPVFGSESGDGSK